MARMAATFRPWRGVLGYGVFTLVAFVVALLYSLPHDLIARRALDEATAGTPVRIAFDRVSLAFPSGYSFRGVRLVAPGPPPTAVEMDDITIRIPLVRLLLGRIDSATFTGRLYGGSFAGSVGETDGRLATSLTLTDVRIAPLSQRLLPPPGQVTGVASLHLELASDGRSTHSAQGDFDLSIRDLELQGLVARGFTVPDLAFATVDLKAGIQAGRVRIDRFQASGEELTIAATGDVLIREPTAQSVLNLQLEIDVAAGERPGLRVATTLLPKRGPGQPKTWSLRGSFASPSLR